MQEFTIGTRSYRTTRLNAFKQLHIARRLVPIIAKIPDMIGLTLDQCLAGKEEMASKLSDNLGAIRLDVIGETIAGLKDEDVNYVLSTCVEAVEIKEPQGLGWSRVSKDGHLMYDFVGAKEMLVFAAHVIKDNLSDFFSDSASSVTLAR
jgi:hypothetical protein